MLTLPPYLPYLKMDIVAQKLNFMPDDALMLIRSYISTKTADIVKEWLINPPDYLQHWLNYQSTFIPPELKNSIFIRLDFWGCRHNDEFGTNGRQIQEDFNEYYEPYLGYTIDIDDE